MSRRRTARPRWDGVHRHTAVPKLSPSCPQVAPENCSVGCQVVWLVGGSVGFGGHVFSYWSDSHKKTGVFSVLEFAFGIRESVFGIWWTVTSTLVYLVFLVHMREHVFGIWWTVTSTLVPVLLWEQTNDQGNLRPESSNTATRFRP